MSECKCDSCEIMQNVEKSRELTGCAWYFYNVVCGDKTIDECTAYRNINATKMSYEEWCKSLQEQTKLAKVEYDAAVSALGETNPPYSDEMILKYLIAKEKYRITGLKHWCACKGYSLKDWIEPR